MSDSPPRITDLSSIEPENFKFRNTDFLTGDSHYDMLSHETKAELRERIWRVRNGDLNRVLEDFPTDRPLRIQCAYWMHAVVGKHFFPDANHRTALALLRKLLRENGTDTPPWPADRIREIRDRSHQARKEVPPVRLDTLYKRDELFLVWWLFFVDVMRPIEG